MCETSLCNLIGIYAILENDWEISVKVSGEILGNFCAGEIIGV